MARSVAVCAEMLGQLVPTFEPPASVDSLDDLRVGVAWTADADPLVRARVEEVAARLAGARPVEVPYADELAPQFMREVAETHRELFAEHRDLYGPNVAAKVARCLEITDAEADAAARTRERYREHLAAVFDEVDVLLTPTIPCVPPPATIDELELRARYVRFTLPFNAIGAPALALPCGPAEEGLPASVQIVGAPGADALVLGAGAALEGALARH